MLYVYDPIVDRKRSLCVECIDAWQQNGLDAPDTDEAVDTDLPCENCAEVARMMEELDE
jgi:hypothetical protein